jgi:hypothetical protein
MQTVTVFGQAEIANFAIAKDLLDVAKRIFHFCAIAGFQLTIVQFLLSAERLAIG